MKLAFYVPSWPREFSRNGIVTYHSNLIPALEDLGHEVFIVTGHLQPGFQDDRVVVIPSRANSMHVLDRALRRLNLDRAIYQRGAEGITAAMQMLMAKQDIDLLQMEESFGWSAMLERRMPFPVVVRLHGPWFLTGNWNGQRRSSGLFASRIDLEGRGIRTAAALTAPSKSVLEATRRRYDLPNEKIIEVIPNSVATAPDEGLWSLQACDRNLLLFVGRFDRLKGADIVLEAFVKLAEQYPALTLAFVGPDIGLQDEASTIWKMDGFAAARIPTPIRDRIKYLGTQSSSEIEKLRRQAFLTLIASRFENFANVALEALAAGCPLVATETGGMPEIIQSGRNGLLVAPGDSDALARGVAQLLAAPEHAAKMGRQGWLDCQSRYAPGPIAAKTSELYERVYKAHRAKLSD